MATRGRRPQGPVAQLRRLTLPWFERGPGNAIVTRREDTMKGKSWSWASLFFRTLSSFHTPPEAGARLNFNSSFRTVNIRLHPHFTIKRQLHFPAILISDS